jgi:hypothetical protein
VKSPPIALQNQHSNTISLRRIEYLEIALANENAAPRYANPKVRLLPVVTSEITKKKSMFVKGT